MEWSDDNGVKLMELYEQNVILYKVKLWTKLICWTLQNSWTQEADKYAYFTFTGMKTIWVKSAFWNSNVVIYFLL